MIGNNRGFRNFNNFNVNTGSQKNDYSGVNTPPKSKYPKHPGKE